MPLPLSWLPSHNALCSASAELGLSRAGHWSSSTLAHGTTLAPRLLSCYGLQPICTSFGAALLCTLKYHGTCKLYHVSYLVVGYQPAPVVPFMGTQAGYASPISHCCGVQLCNNTRRGVRVPLLVCPTIALQHECNYTLTGVSTTSVP